LLSDNGVSTLQRAGDPDDHHEESLENTAIEGRGKGKKSLLNRSRDWNCEPPHPGQAALLCPDEESRQVFGTGIACIGEDSRRETCISHTLYFYAGISEYL